MKKVNGEREIDMIHRFPGCALAFKLDLKNRTLSHEQGRATGQQERLAFFPYMFSLIEYPWITHPTFWMQFL